DRSRGDPLDHADHRLIVGAAMAASFCRIAAATGEELAAMAAPTPMPGRGASAAPTEWSREGCARQPALPARRGRRTPALGLVERARRRRGRAVAAAGRARGAGGPAQPGARLPGHGGSGTRGPATADPAHHRTPGAGDAAA